MPTEKLVGMILSIISFASITITLLKKDEPFFNLRKIFKEHICLFANCKSQYFVFYFFPLLLGIGLSLLFPANSDFFSHLAIVLSIILSMLLALLSILSRYDFSEIEDQGQKSKAQTTIKQTINAILFSCVIGIALLLLGFITITISGKRIDWFPFDIITCSIIVSTFSYYLLVIILLNLLLIIKNMCKIIEFNMLVERKKK